MTLFDTISEQVEKDFTSEDIEHITHLMEDAQDKLEPHVKPMLISAMAALLENVMAPDELLYSTFIAGAVIYHLYQDGFF